MSARQIALGRGRRVSSPEVVMNESDWVVVGVRVIFRRASYHLPMHLVVEEPVFQDYAGTVEAWCVHISVQSD